MAQTTTNSGIVVKPFDDPRVDNYTDAIGVIDNVTSLALNVDDEQLITNLSSRISDSEDYWNDPKGYNLEIIRNENVAYHMGKQDTQKLYRHQTRYVENEIFVGVEAIVAYLTASPSISEVYPSSDNDKSKKLATDLEKVHLAHAEKFNLQRIKDIGVRNLLLKRIGVIYLEYDEDYGENGEIVPHALDPEHVILDKDAAFGGNPGFVCHVLKWSVNKLLEKFPKKKAEIFRELGIKRGTVKQLEQIVAVRRVWITHYEKGKAVEGVVHYFGKCVLDKSRDPNWRYSGKNFLQIRKKPFILLNYVNNGTHLIDETGPVEQATKIQLILNKRGFQIMENADKANPILFISTDSGLSKDDGQNMTGAPNQKIFVKTGGQAAKDLIFQVEAHDLPAFVFQDKLDLRSTLHNILGTPDEFIGANASDPQDKTLGQSQMAKNQASGRQDLIARAIDNWMSDYFNFLTQMMLVWYDKEHFFTYNGGDGDYDFLVMHRYLIEDGMSVTVKSGSSLPFDKQQASNTALELMKEGMIDPYNLYKDLHMDSPQKRYDNWYKWKTSPDELSRDETDAIADTAAYVEFVRIINGEEVKLADDVTLEHVLSHRKQMITDEFLKADSKAKSRLLALVEKEVASLELRQSLDQMSQQGVQQLDPKVPIQPSQPAQPPQVGQIMNGGGQPPGQPGMMTPPPGMPPQAPQGQPGQPMPPPPMPGQLPPPGPPPQPVSGMPMLPPPQGQPAPPMASPLSLPGQQR